MRKPKQPPAQAGPEPLALLSTQVMPLGHMEAALISSYSSLANSQQGNKPKKRAACFQASKTVEELTAEAVANDFHKNVDNLVDKSLTIDRNPASELAFNQLLNTRATFSHHSGALTELLSGRHTSE